MNPVAKIAREKMPIDVLILNSGEWLLSEELAASPWHILIYRQRGDRRNELHVWLPKNGMRGSGEFAFKRYWMEEEVRWCVELPRDPDRARASPLESGPLRIRFSTTDGLILWASTDGTRGLGDFTDQELTGLRAAGQAGSYTRI